LALVSWAVDRQKPAHQLLLHILSALSFMTKCLPPNRWRQHSFEFNWQTLKRCLPGIDEEAR
jgi:hypothetical protein